MRGKKVLTISLLAILLAGSNLRVSAAGVKDVFDAEYYAGRYSDLKSAYGTDEAALLNHFVTRGAYEGRIMSPILDVVAYRAAYADLNAAFGDDWNAYVNHYLTYGIAERRTSGVLFDLVGYVDGNPDVGAVYGEDYIAIARHYITYGIKEGRSSSGLLRKAVTAASDSLGVSGPTGGAPVGNGWAGGSGNGCGEDVSPGGVLDNGGSAGSVSEEGRTAGGISGEGVSGEAAPAGHDHSWKLTDSCAASCREDGYRDYQCQGMVEVRDSAGCMIAIVHCTETKREIIKAVHTRPDEIAHITCEDCTRSGLITYRCTVCGETQQEVIPALGHDYNKEADKPLKSKASTCREAGWDVFACKRCGAEVRETRLLADHVVKEWGVDREAACAGEGIRQGRCSLCSLQVTESIPRTNHANAANINIYADAYEEGTSVRHSVQNITYCMDCGYIIAVSTPSYVNCADAGNGMCGTCGLAVTRKASAGLKVYRTGDYYPVCLDDTAR